MRQKFRACDIDEVDALGHQEQVLLAPTVLAQRGCVDARPPAQERKNGE